MRISKSEREAREAEAIQHLRRLCPASSTVYTVLRSVSRSGMSRTMSVVVFQTGATLPFYLDAAIANAGIAGARQVAGGISVPGCGMDIGFHVVDSLSRELGYTAYDQKLKQYWI